MSVVIATHEREELLRRAVAAVLDQDHDGDIEVLVVFDGCDPVPLEDGDRPHRRVRTMRNTGTRGLAGARNRGIAAATGEWVAFCDDDDTWFATKLSMQLALARRSAAAVAVAGGIEVQHVHAADAGGGRTRVPRLVPYPEVTFAHLLRDRVMELHPSTLLVRRDMLAALGNGDRGPVDELLPGSYAEDYDLLLRLAKIAPIPCVPEPLVAVEWGGSYFADRFATIADALEYLLGKYPEFASVPAGRARIEGQIAFYSAAAGRRGDALRWTRRALGDNWREPRGYLAALVAARAVGAPRVLRTLNARGRGV